MAKRIKRCDCPDCATIVDACICASPECTLDCVSETSGYLCDTEFNGTGAGCGTLDQLIPPCVEEGEAQHIVVTVEVRLLLTGLVVGQSYRATINLAESPGSGTDSIVIDFTAAAAEEATSYYTVPNPASTGAAGWSAVSCSIVEL